MRYMCSSLELRLLLAKDNPDPLKHVTLNLDGHDTRISYIGADEPSLYSYKLRKSGFRIQVCSDMNNIVLFVSWPAPCRDYSDGTMLAKMNIASHIHKLDCIAPDGGYSRFVRQTVDSSDALSDENFSYPVCKTRGIDMTDQEVYYNKAFSGFRSSIEGCFEDMQSTFAKFAHDAPIRFSGAKTFDLQFKLCCLLMNTKKVVSIHNIATQTHHTFWMQDAFDYPDNKEHQVAYEKLPSIKVKLSHGRSLLELQEAFLSVAISQPSALDAVDEIMVEATREEYEVARILDHRGEDDGMESLVLWQGFEVSEARF